MMTSAALCLVLFASFAPSSTNGARAGEQTQHSGDKSGGMMIALVSGLSGSAFVHQPRRAELRLFDWVRAGAIVDVPRGSSLTLVLSNGSRFELTGPAKATVSSGRLSATSGSVRALSAVPRLPRLAPITNRKQEGRQSAAVRVRGPRINNLYPSNAAVTLTTPSPITFDAVEGATEYAIEIEDASGAKVFEIRTAETSVPIPRTLEAAATYYWRVRTVGRVGAQARGEAEFRTLEASDEQARAALKETLEKNADPHMLALLAHIDFGLGLFREARDGVRIALEKGSADPALRTALLQLSRRLETP